MTHRASVGIISIGEMGLGVAKLLASQNYRVVTNITGRSQQTHDRASRADITLLSTDIDLYHQADYILSIVPPKDALSTASRFVEAHTKQPRPSGSPPLYYLDLNAIAPSSALAIAQQFAPMTDSICLIDGGIIGGPPKQIDAADISANEIENESDCSKSWTRPSIVLSGPHQLLNAPKSGSHLAHVLSTKHVADSIGTASGLKCCYASLTKGFTALAIQSFSTAAKLGVLDDLRAEMRAGGAGGVANETRAVKGLVGMVTKSGRWVAEMQEIGKTFREEGGWEGADGGSVFDEIAEVYRFVAEDTVLGKEKSGHRVRGKTGEDVVAAILESRE